MRTVTLLLASALVTAFYGCSETPTQPDESSEGLAATSSEGLAAMSTIEQKPYILFDLRCADGVEGYVSVIFSSGVDEAEPACPRDRDIWIIPGETRYYVEQDVFNVECGSWGGHNYGGFPSTVICYKGQDEKGPRYWTLTLKRTGDTCIAGPDTCYPPYIP